MNVENIENKRCPVCKGEVSENARFCQACGTHLTDIEIDSAWVAAMQAGINHAKDGDLFYTVFSVLGALTAIVVPFVMRFVLRFTMDSRSWLLTGVGMVFFLGGYAGVLYSEWKKNRLIKRLEIGEPSNIQEQTDLDPDWLNAIHEGINHARDNDLYYTIFALLGALTAIVVPFVMRYLLRYTLDWMSWTLTIIGIVFFLLGFAGVLYGERKQNRLIKQLEAGTPEYEYEEDEE